METDEEPEDYIKPVVIGRPFTKEYQPDPSKKTHGPQPSYVARRILRLRTRVSADTLKELIDTFPDIGGDTFSGEELALLIQLNNAIARSDATAIKLLLAQAYGQPKLPLGGEGDGQPIPVQTTVSMDMATMENFHKLLTKKL